MATRHPGSVGAVHTRIVWDRAAIKALRTDPGVHEHVDEVSHQVATRMRATAPKHSGAGAESIRAKWARSKESGAADIGWDAAHYYLIFPEYGTKFQATQRFARDVLKAFTIH